MNLPAFDLPIPPLPIDIPVLMHPPLVHFAIVLPIFILVLEIINIVMKRRALTVTTFVFFTLLVVIFAGAYLTGKTDGKEAWDLLGSAGQADLKEHKLIGTYLLLGSVAMIFVKLFSMALRTWWMKLIYLIALVAFVAAVLFQGKEGGELVYEHGANVEKVKTLDDQVFDLKEEISDMADDEEEEETQQPAKAEEPKAEEPKAEEPKAEEPKAEEPKAEEPKAEEPKAEETKDTDKSTQEANSTKVISDEVKQNSEKLTQEVKEKTTTTQKVQNAAKEAVKSIKESVKPVTDKIKEVTK